MSAAIGRSEAGQRQDEREEIAERIADIDVSSTAQRLDNDGFPALDQEQRSDANDKVDSDPKATLEDAREGGVDAESKGGSTFTRLHSKKRWQQAVRRASFNQIFEYKGADLVAKIASHAVKALRNTSQKFMKMIEEERSWRPDDDSSRGRLLNLLASWQF
ncbi:hypothetical protein RI054_37g140290 [Pseudoscourfieldia marina]